MTISEMENEKEKYKEAFLLLEGLEDLRYDKQIIELGIEEALLQDNREGLIGFLNPKDHNYFLNFTRLLTWSSTRQGMDVENNRKYRYGYREHVHTCYTFYEDFCKTYTWTIDNSRKPQRDEDHLIFEKEKNLYLF